MPVRILLLYPNLMKTRLISISSSGTGWRERCMVLVVVRILLLYQNMKNLINLYFGLWYLMT